MWVPDRYGGNGGLWLDCFDCPIGRVLGDHMTKRIAGYWWAFPVDLNGNRLTAIPRIVWLTMDDHIHECWGTPVTSESELELVKPVVYEET